MPADKPQNPDQPLQTYLADRELLLDIVQQLAKDLGREGEKLETEFLDPELFDYAQFITKVAEILMRIDRENQLESVLYRIDMPEKTGGRPTRWHDYNELATLVLNREFRKVWFRKWYRKYGQ